jgi:hypothetical protein
MVQHNLGASRAYHDANPHSHLQLQGMRYTGQAANKKFNNPVAKLFSTHVTSIDDVCWINFLEQCTGTTSPDLCFATPDYHP